MEDKEGQVIQRSKVNFCNDSEILAAIRAKRAALLRSEGNPTADYKLPQCATDPYMRPLVTTVAQQQQPVNRSQYYIKHSSNACQIIGGMACKDCHEHRLKETSLIKQQSSSLPNLDSRCLGGIKQLLSMTRHGSFQPVLPTYQHMTREDKQDYYCPWTRSLGEEIHLPIITQYEQLRRITKRKFRNKTLLNTKDNLPSLDGIERRESTTLSMAAPTNTEIQTPCPPNDYTPQPPVVELWRQWHLHHTHV